VRLLLDTHVVLWEFGGLRKISSTAQEAVNQASELLFSVVSFAEIGVKAAIGNVSVPRDLREHVVGSGLQILQLQAHHGLAVAELPMHHRDPFDRLLIAQARSEQLSIVTADRRIANYEVPVIDAG
jgi:PIN domain nuclease of toxin-antitoxin system